MKYPNKPLLILCIVLMLSNMLLGCKVVKAVPTDTTAQANTETPVSETADSITVEYDKDDTEDNWTKTNATLVTLNNSAMEIQGSGAVGKDGILTITDAGTYVLTGELSEGQVIIDAAKEDTVRIVLNGVTIHCSTSAPIYGKQSNKIIITLAGGTENIISDGTEYSFEDETIDEPNAAIFSKDDLTLNGQGTLKLSANYNNGIGSKDSLIITRGTYEITAVNNGIKGKDNVTIKNGTFSIKSGGDAIQSDNTSDTEKGWVYIDDGTFTIHSDNDGIQAETILQINDGDFQITTGGGSVNAVQKQSEQFQRGPRPKDNHMQSPENGVVPPSETELETSSDTHTPPSGTSPETQENITEPALTETVDEAVSTKALKSGSSIYLTGGTFTIDSCDDGIHTNGTIAVKGGTFSISTGDDGIHADNSLVIDKGTITIKQSYEGLEGANITINGGSIDLTSSDDGLNAAGGNDNNSFTGGKPAQDQFNSNSNYFIRITGGLVSVNASGDGIDANGSLYIDGGTVLVNGPTNGGNGALDYDGHCTVTGGILVAAGSLGMAQTPDSTSTQNILQITYSETQKAGSLMYLADENDTILLAFTPEKDYQTMIISSPSLELNKQYILYTGGTCDGTSTNGLYTTGSIHNGTKTAAFTLTDSITNINEKGTTVTNQGGFGEHKNRGKGNGGMTPPENTAPQTSNSTSTQ